MKLNKTSILSIIILMSAAAGWTQFDRDYIYIVGSSSVYPFARRVAKQTAKKHPIPPPKIEATGTTFSAFLYVFMNPFFVTQYVWSDEWRRF